jgi:hypothetical protein
MKNKIKFGDWFSWEDHDGYIQYAVDDSADIAVVINGILSDNNKMKEHNFKDHLHWSFFWGYWLGYYGAISTEQVIGFKMGGLW